MSQIRDEIRSGEFVWRLELEDVCLNIEKRLTTLIGDAGKRLHTARSRDDTQHHTDVRLYLRASIDNIVRLIHAMQHGERGGSMRIRSCPVSLICRWAQPVVFGHHLMAYFEMLKRDAERLSDCRKRVNKLPLGPAERWREARYPINRKKGGASTGVQAGFAKTRWMRFRTGILPSSFAPTRR